jgi:hypothetical protein
LGGDGIPHVARLHQLVIPAKPGRSTAELVIQLFFFAVIPAQAGIHFDCDLVLFVGKCRASSRPAGEPVTFGITPGILPFAVPRPASLFAPLLRRSAQK